MRSIDKYEMYPDATGISTAISIKFPKFFLVDDLTDLSDIFNELDDLDEVFEKYEIYNPI